jgi:hypothetical protein
MVTMRSLPRLSGLPSGIYGCLREIKGDAAMIVLDHGQPAGIEPDATTSEDDAYFAQFKVPDDLMW